MVEEHKASQRQIRWRLTGPAVSDGTAPVDEVVRLLSSLQSALRHIAESIQDESKGRRRGRPKQSIASEIALRLVRTEPGSFAAVLELPEQTEQARMLDLGEDALESLLAALEIASNTGTLSGVPAVAIPEIRQLTSSALGEGIDSVTFEGGRDRHHVAVFSAPPSIGEQPVLARRRTTLSGRLREVDFKDHTAELYDASGHMTRVVFQPEQEADLMGAANLYVTVLGETEDVAHGRPRLHLESVEVGLQGDEFWEHSDVEAVARSQGIKVLTRDQLERAAFWPDNLDPQDFVAVAYQDRYRVDAN